MTTDLKEITYSRLDRDYSAFYAGEFIGAYPTYHAAELALDDHALYQAEQGPTMVIADWGAFQNGSIDECACGDDAARLLHGVAETDIALCSACFQAYETRR